MTVPALGNQVLKFWFTQNYATCLHHLSTPGCHKAFWNVWYRHRIKLGCTSQTRRTLVEDGFLGRRRRGSRREKRCCRNSQHMGSLTSSTQSLSLLPPCWPEISQRGICVVNFPLLRYDLWREKTSRVDGLLLCAESWW